MNCPFDEVKYKALLKGLRAKEVLISESLNNELFRLEAEFFTAKTFDSPNTLLGEEIIDFVQYGTSDELNEDEDGYPVLRLNEFQSDFIGKPTKYCKLINKTEFESLKLKKDDVLICRTNGNPKLVGKSALVQKDFDYAFASYLYRIRPKQHHINAPTLVMYLNSKYGRMEIEKFSMVSNQVNFSPAKFKEIHIPIFGRIINNQIQGKVRIAYKYLVKSIELYHQAESMLLQDIGYNSFKTQESSINILNLTDSFAKYGRFDAEYYQPKYEDYLSVIKKYYGGYSNLEQIINIKDLNFLPNEQESYKYIELSNIGKFGEIKSYSAHLGKDLPSRARRLINTNDLIISTIEGSLSSCAIVLEEYNNCICSTGFFVLNSNSINTETLLILFKSDPFQNILKQNCSGTILTAINKNDFLQLPIPLIDNSIQRLIKGLVKESNTYRNKSERFLEITKKAIEIFIEQGQMAAIEYIKSAQIL